MIVSASYRTDIPAFYGRWFMNRFRAGWAKVVNPYGRQISTIPLRSGVDGFVFWTRNIAPFMDNLTEIRRVGLPFMIQYTITGYPRALETSVVETARSIALVHGLAKTHGPHSVVWRYDPILLTSLTPADWHQDNFSRLARELTGSVDEVAVSFATFYRKTDRNLATAARAHGFDWTEPPIKERQDLIATLTKIAASHKMSLSVCSQPDNLTTGAKPASCVDARRLEAVAADWGEPRTVPAKLKGNRPGCLCFESRDLGEYDTCPHGCVYCYAVSNRDQAKQRHTEHDPNSEFLFPPPELPSNETPLSPRLTF